MSLSSNCGRAGRRGRGTSDDKAQAAIWIANLIRFKREGFKPDRDIIVALTADEEGGGPYVYPRDDDPSQTTGFEVEIAARLARIGGDGVDLAGAAGCEHHCARRQ